MSRPVAGGGGQVRWVVIAAVLASCAKGLGVDVAPESDAEIPFVAVGGRDAGGAPEDAGGEPAEPAREPCTMGDERICSCPGEATETRVGCLFDDSSPLGGFFEECMPCPEPVAEPDPCMDGDKNGAESDTDCGGPDCAGCAAGNSCVGDDDCASGTCTDSVCVGEGAGAGCSGTALTGSDDCQFPFDVSNFDPAGLTPPAGAIAIGCAAELDTSGTPRFTTWCGGAEPPIVVQTQGGGGEIAVVAMQELTLTGSLRVVGTRPVALAVLGNLSVGAGASIDASATGSTPGAGGSQCSAGEGQGGDSASTANDTGGGGGGGFGTAGGRGGTGDNGGEPAGEAGAVHGEPDLSPLSAGCRGGNTSQCNGGAGGGAIQLTAGGTLTVAGSISVDGAGGPGSDCGAGGGSGGAILLEGFDVDVGSATLTARGGSGSNASAGGPNGAAGSQSASQPGGNGSDGNGADGGSGGGGGYGRIHVAARGGTCTGPGC